jgi:hypothetical protein
LTGTPLAPVFTRHFRWRWNEIGKRGKNALAVKGEPPNAMALSAAYSGHCASSTFSPFDYSPAKFRPNSGGERVRERQGLRNF